MSDTDWPQYSTSDEVNWYDSDLDYDMRFPGLNDTWTNFTMTGINLKFVMLVQGRHT